MLKFNYIRIVPKIHNVNVWINSFSLSLKMRVYNVLIIVWIIYNLYYEQNVSASFRKFHILPSRVFWFRSNEKFSSPKRCSNTKNNTLYVPPDTFIAVLFFQNIVFKFGAISATDDFVKAFDTIAERRRHKTRSGHKNWNIVRENVYYTKYTYV